ncbi:hypothetical protein ADK65_08525 [Streptomyces sp. NRRL B-1140]|nr:hypothetical protein ADK65_08525 [Streptomyces sp. NRRL B-1140]
MGESRAVSSLPELRIGDVGSWIGSGLAYGDGRPFFRYVVTQNGFTESIAQRDQSNSLREPSSSRTRRWSLAQALAFFHSEQRR